MSEPRELRAEMWTEAGGAPPEIEERRPREGLTRLGGPLEGAQFSMTGAPNRIDLVIEPPPQAVLAPGALGVPRPTAGDGISLISLLENKAGVFAVHVGESTRIALGGTFLRAAEDKLDAYKQIQMLLKSVKVDPERMNDFFYRVNWQVPSGSGVKLNRITAWSSVVIRTMNISESGAERILRDRHFAQLDLDINSAVDAAARFSPSQAKSMLSELAALARENLERGEVTT